MADVPCLDHLWDGQKNCPEVGKLGGTSGKYQETCLFACIWDPYGSLAVLGLPIGALVGLLLQQQTKLHMERSLMCDKGVCDEWTCATNICTSKTCVVKV